MLAGRSPVRFVVQGRGRALVARRAVRGVRQAQQQHQRATWLQHAPDLAECGGPRMLNARGVSSFSD